MGLYHYFLRGAILLLGSFLASSSIASAEVIERNFLLNSNGSQSFETLMQQVQTFTQESIEREFIENPEATELLIVVSGEQNGQIVPFLRSRVSRSQWERDARVYKWTRYFANSEVLLGFVDSQSQLVSPQPIPAFSIEDDPGYRDD